MEFRTIEDLHEGVVALSRKIGHVDAVIGIPRSGMLAANLFSLHRNIPLYASHLGQAVPMGHGRRLRRATEPRQWLLMDDSYNSGETLAYHASSLPFKVDKAVVYCSAFPTHPIDYVYEEVGLPRIFEWNMWHHGQLKHTLCDLDGVFCPNPTPEEEKDKLHWIKTVKPIVVPSYRVRKIITSRDKKYQKATESWLMKHGFNVGGVRCDKVGVPPTHKARGRRKGAIYRKDEDARLFIESSQHQAPYIVQCAKKPVLCVETKEMLYP